MSEAILCFTPIRTRSRMSVPQNCFDSQSSRPFLRQGRGCPCRIQADSRKCKQ